MQLHVFSSFFILALIGRCFSEMLPPELSGVRDKNVTFVPDVPSDITPTMVMWSFSTTGAMRGILTVVGAAATVSPAYQGRVSYNATTYELKLIRLRPNDTGNYILNIIVSGNSLNSQTSLSVLETVGDVRITSNLPEAVELNSTVVLSCSAKGSLINYKWMNGSDFIAGDGKHVVVNGSQLTVNGVWRTDLQGPIYCVAENNLEGARSSRFNLTVHYGPEAVSMTQSPTISTLKQGSNLTLTCMAVSSPPAGFSWYFNGVQLPDVTQILVFPNLKAENSGNYSCMAFNSKTLRYTASQVSTVTVLEPISGTTIDGPIFPLLAGNGSCNLTCKSTTGKVDKVDWLKNDKALDFTSRIVRSLDMFSISIPQVTKDDAGLYKCVLINKVSTDSSNLTVSIYYGPETVKILGMNKVEVGNPLMLNCSVDSFPPSSIQWLFNGTNVTGATQDFYFIKDSTQDQSGNYTCVAYNSATDRRKTATHILKVKGVGESNDELSSGAIAGIVIAVLLALTILTCIIVKKRRKIRDVPSPY